MPVPKIRFKTIHDYKRYVLAFNSNKSAFKRSEWPCVQCNGKGKVRHEEDRDIIEGYKLAPWHKCDACNGTGRIEKHIFEAFWQHEMQRDRQARADHTKYMRLCKSARSKLTQEELDAIQRNKT